VVACLDPAEQPLFNVAAHPGRMAIGVPREIVY
jgi:hypothetical protein